MDVPVITRKRAGQIARAVYTLKIRKNGFDAKRERLTEWISKTARITGFDEEKIAAFVPQVIFPNLPDSRIVNPPDGLDGDTIERICLALIYEECSNLSRLDERVDAFMKAQTEFTADEVKSFVIYYLFQHYYEALQKRIGGK